MERPGLERGRWTSEMSEGFVEKNKEPSQLPCKSAMTVIEELRHRGDCIKEDLRDLTELVGKLEKTIDHNAKRIELNAQRLDERTT